MTWKDIKLATIQKMFSADGATIPSDDSTRDYLAAMPYAANEAILMLSTAGKFLVKDFSIAVSPIKNLLSSYNASSIHSVESGDMVYEADKVKSYYFEVTGKCTASVILDDVAIKTYTIDDVHKYESIKGIVDNTENHKVTISFTSEYPYAIKNIAMYEAKYDEDSQVPMYAEKMRYHIPDIVEDFYSVNSIYFEGENPRYIKTDEVYQEGDKTLIFDSSIPGNYIIYYNALPVTITAGTEDDYELPLDREVAALLPMYMASQLYKDDDVAIATQYRNEFEVAFERLKNSQPSGKAERITSESGWI